MNVDHVPEQVHLIGPDNEPMREEDGSPIVLDLPYHLRLTIAMEATESHQSIETAFNRILRRGLKRIIETDPRLEALR